MTKEILRYTVLVADLSSGCHPSSGRRGGASETPWLLAATCQRSHRLPVVLPATLCRVLLLAPHPLSFSDNARCAITPFRPHSTQALLQLADIYYEPFWPRPSI